MSLRTKELKNNFKRVKLMRFRVPACFGFTLIEVIIALALALVTVLIFGTALSSLPLTRTARNQNLAYHIAAKKIEELRNTEFDSLPVSGSFGDPGLSDLASSFASLLLVDYEGSSDIKSVTVTVNWYEGDEAENAVLDTLISRNGVGK